MKTTGEKRLDVTLVERGLARSRTRAGELIRANRVQVDDARAIKPSQFVSQHNKIVMLSDDSKPDYVSRAATKLAGVLQAFDGAEYFETSRFHGPNVENQFCVDVGASTGGFTDVLLRHGARHVLAIDVGHNQFDPTLAQDSKITVREGVNVRDINADDIPEPVGLIVGDLSFISLSLVLPALVKAMPTAELLLLVKPQFEVGKERLGRGGVVRDADLHVAALSQVCASAQSEGLEIRAVVASSLPGANGNREFFCWMAPSTTAQDSALVQEGIVDAVHDPTLGRSVFYVGHPTKKN